MWFRNLRAFRLSAPFELSPEAVEVRLQRQVFSPCAPSQRLSLGWVPALADDTEALVHAASGRLLLRLKREEKLLPAGVVRELVAARVQAIEAEQGRKVRRRERLRLQDDVIAECLPRAFSRSTHLRAVIDPAAGWLFVDSNSPAKAEELLNLLRESLGTLPVLLPRVERAPAAVMTGWLQHRTLPDDFRTAGECELRDPGEDGGVVRCRGVDLFGEEVEGHLAAGRRVVRIALRWEERLGFVLAEDLCLRRLRFDDELLKANDELDGDPLQRLDADFLLLGEALAAVQERVLNAFGGMVESD